MSEPANAAPNSLRKLDTYVAQLSKPVAAKWPDGGEVAADRGILGVLGSGYRTYFYVPADGLGMPFLIYVGRTSKGFSSPRTDKTLGLALEGVPVSAMGYTCAREWTGMPSFFSESHPDDPNWSMQRATYMLLRLALFRSQSDRPHTYEEFSKVLAEDYKASIVRVRKASQPSGTTLRVTGCGVSLTSGVRLLVLDFGTGGGGVNGAVNFLGKLLRVVP